MGLTAVRPVTLIHTYWILVPERLNSPPAPRPIPAQLSKHVNDELDAALVEGMRAI